MGVPFALAVHAGGVVWAEDEKLVEAPLDGAAPRVLAEGNADWTPSVVADGLGAYWVRSSAASCDIGCTRWLERVAAGGTVALAERDRPVVALAQDAAYLYWLERSMETVEPGCDCGSTVRRVPKSGGPATVVVDGRSGARSTPRPLPAETG